MIDRQINRAPPLGLQAQYSCSAAAMAVLGDVPMKKFIHFGAIVNSCTILVCYTIAVELGHVPAWLPTISACGEHPPEQYIFRYGLLSGGLMLAALSLYIYMADFSFSRSLVNVILGVTAGLCLGVIAICAANEDRNVHLCECY